MDPGGVEGVDFGVGSPYQLWSKCWKINNLYSKAGLKMQDMHQKMRNDMAPNKRSFPSCKMEMFGTFCPLKREPL